MSRGFSLRGRLLRWLVALLGLALLLQAGLIYHSLLSESEDIFDYQMTQVAQILARSDGIREALPAEAEDDEDLRFYLQVWQGSKLEYASDRNQLMPRQAQPGFADVHADAGVLRIHTHVRGDVQVQVGQELEERHEIAREMALESAWPMLALAVAILLATALITTLALRPLTRLQQELAMRQPGELRPLDGSGLPREILPLAEETNALMQRMAQAYEQQRRFVSDAAHELRTPLTALALQNEAIRQAGEGEALHAAIVRQRQGIARATRLVEQLLLLARQDAGEKAVRLIALPLQLTQLQEEFAPLAAAARLDLQVHAADAPALEANPAALQAVLRNLLDNALKYTPAGGRVQLRARALDARQGEIRVEDSGPGIAGEERERVFDRFYRIAGTHAQGSGLGLAIARHAAASFAAQLHLEDSPLGGLAAVLVFPLAVPEKPPLAT